MINHITFALNSSWDSYLDDAGNIAIISGAAAVAQDVASACRLFVNDAYHNKNQGIPYKSDILGYQVPLPIVSAMLEAQAKTVPHVSDARATLSLVNRALGGTIAITLSDGTAVNVALQL